MKINTIKLNKDKNGKVPYLKTILKERPIRYFVRR